MLDIFKAPRTPAYLKAGILGKAGSGKTYTATLLAVGCAKHFKSDKPILFLDTEGGSDYIIDRVQSAGLELLTAKTRSFTDLLETVQHGHEYSDVLIIDSITHFWQEFKETYLREKQRKADEKARRYGRKPYKVEIQFPDWNYLKSEWAKFTTAYLNSPMHIVMCGRLGYDYGFQENENGKKELIKEDIKMKAESETGYEPSLLIKMERMSIINGERQQHMATVVKDRFGLIDGKQMVDPKFSFFAPHIEALKKLAENEAYQVFDESRDSTELVKEEVDGYHDGTNKRLVNILVDEIKTYLETHYPGSSKESKEARGKILLEVFETASYEALAIKQFAYLKEGFVRIKELIESKEV